MVMCRTCSAVLWSILFPELSLVRLGADERDWDEFGKRLRLFRFWVDFVAILDFTQSPLKKEV